MWLQGWNQLENVNKFEMINCLFFIYLKFLIYLKTALKIHVSENCREILDKIGGYILSERGIVQVKVFIVLYKQFINLNDKQGKGEMKTFWLKGKHLNKQDQTKQDNKSK